jgi:hypothetical protein
MGQALLSGEPGQGVEAQKCVARFPAKGREREAPGCERSPEEVRGCGCRRARVEAAGHPAEAELWEFPGLQAPRQAGSRAPVRPGGPQREASEPRGAGRMSGVGARQPQQVGVAREGKAVVPEPREAEPKRAARKKKAARKKRAEQKRAEQKRPEQKRAEQKKRAAREKKRAEREPKPPSGRARAQGTGKRPAMWVERFAREAQAAPEARAGRRAWEWQRDPLWEGAQKRRARRLHGPGPALRRKRSRAAWSVRAASRRTR